MANETCDCDSTGRQVGADETGRTGHWIDGPNVVDAPLPDDVRAAMGRFLGDGSVETIADVVATLRDGFGGGSIEVDDLCHAGEPTPHRGAVDGETYHFRCFYDAVILAELTGSPTDVRTEAPDGTPIEAHATGAGGLAVTPPDAAMSFGIAGDVDPPSGDGPTLEAGYAAICPYVRAFPNRSAYEEWAATVPAATVGAPLANATDLAARFAE